MKIQLLSDLHVNTWKNLTLDIQSDVDLLLIPGDVHFDITKSCEYLESLSQQHQKPIFFCLGNHEAEDMGFRQAVEYAKEFCHNKAITVFDNDIVIKDDITFVGGTLWSDFKVFGDVNHWFVTQACRQIHDFESIPDLTINNAETWFQKTKETIEYALYNNERQGKAVVLTHFAPSFSSIADCYQKDYLSGYFASNLDSLMGFEGVWVHGHTHTSFDYQKGDTRVLCNPVGTGFCPNTNYQAVVFEI